MDVELAARKWLPEERSVIAFTTAFGHYDSRLEGDEARDDDGTLPTIDLQIATLSVRHHFGEGWSADALLSAGSVSLTDADDEVKRISGLGDIGVGGRYDLAALWGGGGYSPSLALQLGVILPTATQALRTTNQAVPPSLLGTGMGSFGLTTGVTLTQFLHRRVAISIPTSLRAPLSRSDLGRLPGTSTMAGLSFLVLPADVLSLRGGVSLEHLFYADEEQNGTVLNSGGGWLRADAHAAVRLGDHAIIGAGARVPIYADVNGRQTSETFTILATLAVTVGGGEEERDHGDEQHGDEQHGDEQHGDEQHGEGDVIDLSIVPMKAL